MLYHILIKSYKTLRTTAVVLLFLCSFVLVIPQVRAAELEKCTIQGGCSQQGIRLTQILKDNKVSTPFIISAGLIDGINPCAIGMLILLLGYLMVFAKQPERMFKTGLVYIATIFITYFSIGFLFSSVVYKLIAWPYYYQISDYIKYVIIALVGLAGFINVKDFFWYGKGYSLGIKKEQAPFLMKYIKQATIPATIVLGVLVTLFELPCSLPLYVGTITIMSSSFQTIVTLYYLFIYNLMFVLPLIVLFVILLKTKKIFEAKDLQERGNKWMKLVMGLAQIAAAVTLYFL